MAEIRMESGLIGERARIVDHLGDEQVPAVDPNKPQDELAELTSWVMNRVRQWRDHRRQNYELLWDEYERKWRGMWNEIDKGRKSERSTLVTPALAEAVENIVAEVEEAMFGRGDVFDMQGELDDPVMLKEITDKNKAYLKEDLGNTDFNSHIGEALINAAVYGTGIAEIFVQKHKLRDIVASVQAMQPGVPPQMQIIVKEVTFANAQSVNPRNFLIDPIARSIDTALGVAVEEYVGSHIIKAGQKYGDYRKVNVGTSAGDIEIGVDRQIENEYVHDKVHIIRYYGLVPEHLLLPPDKVVNLFPANEGEALGEAVRAAEDAAEHVNLHPHDDNTDETGDTATSGEKSVEPIDSDMVEALVFIANGAVCIKAVRSPYLMEDRPVVAFPWDIVPGRFWGRGVCEKGIVPQKVMDAELRARIDALAYVSAPMMAMDASKLPRGFQLTVKPGKSILTNGDPKNILNPIHFGQLDQSTFQHSQQLDQMIQRATGSLDVISLASRAGGDSRPGAVSMMLSGIVKRHKRTLMSFIDRFFVPLLRKIMWRNMQFYPMRYTPLNWTFNCSGTMGILQREYESQQLVSLMQTMDPQSKEYKILLMGVISNTGLIHRTEIMKMVQTSIDNAAAMEKAQTQTATDPMQQQVQQVGMQLQVATGEAKIAELKSRARLQDVKAQNAQLEPQFRQVELATKGIYQVHAGEQDRVLQERLALVDRAIKLEDIHSNERIAHMQSSGKVNSEGIKSVGAVATEAVRARALAKDAQAKTAAAVIGSQHQAVASVVGSHHKAVSHVEGQRHAAAATVSAARIKAKAAAQQFQGRQAKLVA